MWNNTCELAEPKYEVNENGFEEKTLTKKEVFCNEKSVTSDEFYKSCQEGNEVKVVLEVKLIDYNREEFVYFEEELYKVKRTYKVNSEDIELHLVSSEGIYE